MTSTNDKRTGVRSPPLGRWRAVASIVGSSCVFRLGAFATLEPLMFASKFRFSVQVALVLPALVFFVSACGDEASDGLEIQGNYTDDFDTSHEITSETWTIAGTEVFHVVAFDNDAAYLIAENDAENEYFPEAWSRFEWTRDADTLYYCQPVYDGENEDVARSAQGAEHGDLQAGCDGFPWSILTED